MLEVAYFLVNIASFVYNTWLEGNQMNPKIAPQGLSQK
jgi:hypothetical protein